MNETVTVRKANRVLRVSPGQLNRFLKQGYNQIDDHGQIIKLATGGASVNIAKYNALLQENQQLKEDLVVALETIEELKK